MEDAIKKFLAVGDGAGSGAGAGSGYGDGDGDGYGYGSGYGYGYGYGDGDGAGSGSGAGYGDGDGYGYGYGAGSGSGYGYGYGYGYGSGVKNFCGAKVFYIDGVPTVLDSVHSNYAKGRIVNKDLTVTPCFVAKVDDIYFAHGETLRVAVEGARNKSFSDMPLEDRLNKFIERYPLMETVAKNIDLFTWHNRFTGSCRMGRLHFAAEHDIDVENGSMTINEFIALTKDSYGGEAIKQLKKRYE